MTQSEQAAYNLAEAFGVLNRNHAHKALYIESLTSFANMVRQEVLADMELSFQQAQAALREK